MKMKCHVGEMDKGLVGDPVACAYLARILYVQWGTLYDVDDLRAKEREKKLSFKYAKQAALASGSTREKYRMPAFLSDIPELQKHFLLGLPVQSQEYFKCTVRGDMISVSFVDGKGDGHLHLPRSIRASNVLRRPLKDLHINEISYDVWADDPYAAEPRLGCYRIDDPAHGECGRLVLMVDHPASGWLCFPGGDDEVFSIIALASLVNIAVIPGRTNDELLAIQEAADSISSRCVGVSFLPSDGICSSCDGDVTQLYPVSGPIDSITGCGLCLRTWCD